jgi:hypothetical protein
VIKIDQSSKGGKRETKLWFTLDGSHIPNLSGADESRPNA